MNGRVQRARWMLACRVGGSLAMFAILLALLPVDEIVQAVGKLSPAVWGTAVLIYLCLHLLGVVKWRLLINAGGARIPLRSAMRFYYAGLFGNLFLPSVVGGDAVRAGLAFGPAHSKQGLLLGSVLDRVIDLGSLALLTGFGLLIIPTRVPEARGLFLGLAMLATGGLAMGGAGLYLAPIGRLSMRWRRRLVQGRHAVRAIARNPMSIVHALALAVLLQGGLVLLSAWLAFACGLRIPLHAWFVAWPLAKLAALVPFTQGGMGVREAALAALMATFGVPAASAVAAGLVFQLVVLTGGLLGGLPTLIHAIRRPLRRANAPAAPFEPPVLGPSTWSAGSYPSAPPVPSEVPRS